MSEPTEQKTLGQICFEAGSAAMGSNDSWKNLDVREQRANDAAASAVAAAENARLKAAVAELAGALGQALPAVMASRMMYSIQSGQEERAKLWQGVEHKISALLAKHKPAAEGQGE